MRYWTRDASEAAEPASAPDAAAAAGALAGRLGLLLAAASLLSWPRDFSDRIQKLAFQNDSLHTWEEGQADPLSRPVRRPHRMMSS
jgi:hypothetical protein